jgi:hypothetical protein
MSFTFFNGTVVSGSATSPAVDAENYSHIAIIVEREGGGTTGFALEVSDDGTTWLRQSTTLLPCESGGIQGAGICPVSGRFYRMKAEGTFTAFAVAHLS